MTQPDPANTETIKSAANTPNTSLVIASSFAVNPHTRRRQNTPTGLEYDASTIPRRSTKRNPFGNNRRIGTQPGGLRARGIRRDPSDTATEEKEADRDDGRQRLIPTATAQTLFPVLEAGRSARGWGGENWIRKRLGEDVDEAVVSAVNYGRTLQEPMCRMMMRAATLWAIDEIHPTLQTLLDVADANLDTLMAAHGRAQPLGAEKPDSGPACCTERPNRPGADSTQESGMRVDHAGRLPQRRAMRARISRPRSMVSSSAA